jgi:uncharacterized membrane protein YidH (DUF202 family)
MSGDRPREVFDRGLQHERNSLAWERTAIASMVAGVLLARYAAQSLHLVFAFVGFAEVLAGASVLLWSGQHYENLHGRLRSGESPVHPTAARIVGIGSIIFTGLATALAVVIVFVD